MGQGDYMGGDGTPMYRHGATRFSFPQSQMADTYGGDAGGPASVDATAKRTLPPIPDGINYIRQAQGTLAPPSPFRYGGSPAQTKIAGLYQQGVLTKPGSRVGVQGRQMAANPGVPTIPKNPDMQGISISPAAQAKGVSAAGVPPTADELDRANMHQSVLDAGFNPENRRAGFAGSEDRENYNLGHAMRIQSGAIPKSQMMAAAPPPPSPGVPASVFADWTKGLRPGVSGQKVAGPVGVPGRRTAMNPGVQGGGYSPAEQDVYNRTQRLYGGGAASVEAYRKEQAEDAINMQMKQTQLANAQRPQPSMQQQFESEYMASHQGEPYQNAKANAILRMGGATPGPQAGQQSAMAGGPPEAGMATAMLKQNPLHAQALGDPSMTASEKWRGFMATNPDEQAKANMASALQAQYGEDWANQTAPVTQFNHFGLTSAWRPVNPAQASMVPGAPIGGFPLGRRLGNFASHVASAPKYMLGMGPRNNNPNNTMFSDPLEEARKQEEFMNSIKPYLAKGKGY